MFAWALSIQNNDVNARTPRLGHDLGNDEFGVSALDVKNSWDYMSEMRPDVSLDIA